ncbi:MAG: hypothetical protein WC895_03935 [Candidatus Shapirobacteria bacterium]|jgi:hypothetical protein
MSKEKYSLDKLHKITLGSYSIKTDLDITQIEYWGGNNGYSNLLKINDPPQGKSRYIVHNYRENSYLLEDSDPSDLRNYIFCSNGCFAEFNDLDDAKTALKKSFSFWQERGKEWFNSQGVGQFHFYDNKQKPWFYCKKDEIHEGIFVLSDEG